MYSPIIILLQLFLAHLVTDFVFQPKKWIDHKRTYKAKSKYLYIHAAVAGITTYVFLQDFKLWYIALIIAITHFFIDWWKLSKRDDNLKYFILDQLLHLLVIVTVWLSLINGFNKILPFFKEILNSIPLISIIIAYLFVIFPAGFLIGKATQRWQNEIELTSKKTSLDAAGRYIGIFERILVLTFILTQNFSAIGFLIAAKSILRFSEKSETGARKQTEYVLIGTLMSFAITIIIGLLVSQFQF